MSLQHRRTATLYGRMVCKSCRRKFTSRRVGAFILDLVIGFLWLLLGGTLLENYFPDAGVAGSIVMLVPPLVFFLLKDGLFSGRGVGKGILGLRVIDRESGEPASVGASFLRNLPVLVLLGVLLYGMLADTFGRLLHKPFPFWPFTLVAAYLAYEVTKAPRIGDGWAKTRVIIDRHSSSPAFLPVSEEAVSAVPRGR